MHFRANTWPLIDSQSKFFCELLESNTCNKGVCHFEK